MCCFRCSHVSPSWQNVRCSWLQIKLLIEEGKADVLKTDRWGATALDEVTKLGATRCMAYLKPITEAAVQRQRQQHEEEAALDAAAQAQLD